MSNKVAGRQLPVVRCLIGKKAQVHKSTRVQEHKRKRCFIGHLYPKMFKNLSFMMQNNAFLNTDYTDFWPQRPQSSQRSLKAKKYELTNID